MIIHKPRHYAAENAAAFQDDSVVAAYRYRPPYPEAIFEILLGLLPTASRRVLDVGCGTGNIARYLVDQVDQIDAVDFSLPMITDGQQLPHGDHPRLRWWHGRAEDVALDPPYGLVIAGASLHWMDWPVVLPRFRDLLVPGGYLALVTHNATPDPWSILDEIVTEYRTDGGFQPFDLLAELAAHGLFRKVGEQRTTPIPFVQTIDDYIESYHSRSGFSRERMGLDRAAAFDQAASAALHAAYPAGQITFQVTGHVLWGLPGGGD